ncbi:choice-of-anchor H family protein [Shewanella acanthi]|uniref:choice-of-anchor H family protein n=1 Tax=Shewanella acanthi TaxID=2864212 RepID=UPI001C6594BD|nr:choice-of-anchor H family protein [Shewanella acanthi]QYJ78720.1 choice-of-anchor H family protein [Shewanella acanthi]
MNTFKKLTVKDKTNSLLVTSTAIAALLVGAFSVSAEPLEASSQAPTSIDPFSVGSVGIVKKADEGENALQQQQAMELLKQSAPAQSVGDAAVAAVKSFAPSLSPRTSGTKVQLVGATPKTRDQVIAEHLSQPIPTSSASTADPYRSPVYHDFAIYEAYSRLFEDFDYDGFYQTFSVTFDVDVFGAYLNERADLYAELYLSRNGGPWVHYYTTDVFTIYGDSTTDDYEVLTTLYSGYSTDYYDVLIDVYEVGYSDIVATISADETDGLYALPLESSDRDQGSEVIIVEESGGALSSIGLLFLGLFGATRLKRAKA